MNVCRKNKFSYCKFRNTCRYQHIYFICDNSQCEIESCERRHPIKCNYFTRFSRCKFGVFCKYSHVTLSKHDEKGIRKLEAEITELKIHNDKIEKEIELMKMHISNIMNENCELKKFLETEKNDSAQDFKCDKCNFKGKNVNGLKVHKSLKHKNIIQVDGNIDTTFDTENTEDKNQNKHVLKAVFIGEDAISAEAELREFYISELICNYSEDILLLEDESGDIYDGFDHCYNKGGFKKYTFIFSISDTYSWEEI